MTSNTQYIAIDIAKQTLQVQSDLQSLSLLYNQEGLKQLRAFIKRHQHPMVIAEATGGCERPLMSMLYKYKITVALLNPRLARAFAVSEGIKAKTDPIDAKMLLSFAKEKSPRPTEYIGAQREELGALMDRRAQREELGALMDRRAQLTEHIAKEKNRLDKNQKIICGSINKMIRILDKELALIEARITKLIDSNEQMQAQSKLMQQVCGVGPNTAWSILAYLSEITALNRNQLVALAGLAPYNRDSGKFKGKRTRQGGRAKVRKTLYMAAQTAAIHNPTIKTYVDRLRNEKGKPYKCAMTAAMRKILVHLQSLLKNQQILLD
jgi:transposase